MLEELYYVTGNGDTARHGFVRLFVSRVPENLVKYCSINGAKLPPEVVEEHYGFVINAFTLGSPQHEEALKEIERHNQGVSMSQRALTNRAFSLAR